jgi:hypothetical protein
MAALEQLYGEAQCRQIASSMQTSMGMQPGAPIEGRAIVEWMLADDSAACIDITTSTEASLVGTLFLEMGIIAPVDEGTGASERAPTAMAAAAATATATHTARRRDDSN